LAARHLLLRVLFFRAPHDPNTWIAQALEHDVAAYGRDMEHAKLAFERTISGYIQLGKQSESDPLASLPQAPDEFWERWLRVALKQTLQAESLPSFPGIMLPAVTDEQVSTAH
jgi:hypothetical protein